MSSDPYPPIPTGGPPGAVYVLDSAGQWKLDPTGGAGAYVAAPPVSQAGLFPVPLPGLQGAPALPGVGQAAKDAAGAIGNATGLSAVTGLAASLADRHTWTRVVQVLGGLVALVLGAYLIEQDVIRNAAGAAKAAGHGLAAAGAAKAAGALL